MTDDEPDLYQSVGLLVEKYGFESGLKLAQASEQEMADRGDLVGQAAWRAIAGAIELLKRKAAAGGRMH